MKTTRGSLEDLVKLIERSRSLARALNEPMAVHILSIARLEVTEKLEDGYQDRPPASPLLQ
jgi:hypothetical protein